MKPLFYLAVIVVYLEASRGLTITTQLGNVIGTEDENCIAYLGIPYAAPPMRWRPPVKLDRFPTEPLLATSWKPMCYQGTCGGAKAACNSELSEDCLYLNIYAPKGTQSNSSLAVMLYIHGGSFSDLTAMSDVYYGGNLANIGGIIVVTFNYRLNAFAGLFTGTSDNDATGNYGILDQKMAIRWVFENINDYGGNNYKITLSGQSAGAQSVLLHIMAGNVTDMFSQVIIQSAPISVPFRSYKDALRQGKLFASNIGCRIEDMDCMRSTSASDIYKASLVIYKFSTDSILVYGEQWLPIVDGDNVKNTLNRGFIDTDAPLYLSDALSSKAAIIGTVADEGLMFIHYILRHPLPVIQYFLMLLGFKQVNGIKVFGKYRRLHGHNMDAREEAASVFADFAFICPSRSLANKMQRSGDVWMYSYTHALDTHGMWKVLEACENRVCHGSDVTFMFQTTERMGLQISDDDNEMSRSIMTYFANFVKTGNPNSGIKKTNNVPWPKYKNDDTERKFIIFDSPKNQISHSLKYELCNMWDSMPPYFAKRK